MAWLPFIMALIEMFAKCREDREQDELAAMASDMGIVATAITYRLAIRTIRKEEGLRGKKLRREARSYVQRAKNSTPEELAAVLESAEAVYAGDQE